MRGLGEFEDLGDTGELGSSGACGDPGLWGPGGNMGGWAGMGDVGDLGRSGAWGTQGVRGAQGAWGYTGRFGEFEDLECLRDVGSSRDRVSPGGLVVVAASGGHGGRCTWPPSLCPPTPPRTTGRAASPSTRCWVRPTSACGPTVASASSASRWGQGRGPGPGGGRTESGRMVASPFFLPPGLPPPAHLRLPRRV